MEIDPYAHGMPHLLGLVEIESTPTVVRMDMEIRDDLRQISGFLHGGATLALLESCASWGTVLNADLETQLAFGTQVECRHLNSAQNGTVHGEARLVQVDDLGERGKRYLWSIRATQDGGRVLSEGTFTCRVVSKAYFEAREAKH